MNTVDYLLEHKFSSMSFESKLEIKTLGTHHPKNFTLTNKGKEGHKNKSNLTFQVEWFQKKVWLPASE